MVDVVPDDELALDILEHFDDYVERLKSERASQHVGDDFASGSFLIDHVPGAISPVRAKAAFTQIPKEGGTELVSVYKVWFGTLGRIES
jgi:extracellular elastinolytic metalloproteinase